MKLYEQEFKIPIHPGEESLLSYFSDGLQHRLGPRHIPIRFAVTVTDQQSYNCEVGILSPTIDDALPRTSPLFNFRQRQIENIDQFNVVLLVPTGIGAKIGGDAGDAAPVARLIAGMCDNLITHPNVVNASDINELPPNGLYVEGSVLTRLIMGTAGLQKVRSNRLLLIIDDHNDPLFSDSAINSASAARATLGLECNVIKMSPGIRMEAYYSSSGKATGRVVGFERLFKVLSEHRHEFDAVAISSIISVPRDLQLDYFAQEMTNPWGGVEAVLTHAISSVFEVPSAHSPMLEDREILDAELGIVDPRKAAEAVSMTFLHCILKGLHKSPRIINDPQAMAQVGVISVEDISCMIIPDGCLGLPTLAAIEQGIPVIVVKENSNSMKNNLADLPFKHGKLLWADNYLEAVGIMGALKSGVALESVRRSLSPTTVSETLPTEFIEANQ